MNADIETALTDSPEPLSLRVRGSEGQLMVL